MFLSIQLMYDIKNIKSIKKNINSYSIIQFNHLEM